MEKPNLQETVSYPLFYPISNYLIITPARLSLVVEPTAVGSNPLVTNDIGHYLFFSITQNPAISDGVFNVVGTIGLTTKVAAQALISFAYRRSAARLSLVVEPTAVGSNPLGVNDVEH